VLRKNFEPVGLVIQPRANIRLSRCDARRSGLRGVTVQHQIPEEDQRASAPLVWLKTVRVIPRSLVDSITPI